MDGTVSAPFTHSQLDAAFESREDRRRASPARKTVRILWVLMILVFIGLRLLRWALGN